MEAGLPILLSNLRGSLTVRREALECIHYVPGIGENSYVFNGFEMTSQIFLNSTFFGLSKIFHSSRAVWEKTGEKILSPWQKTEAMGEGTNINVNLLIVSF